MKNNLLKSGIVFLAGRIVPGGAVIQLLMQHAVHWGADKLTQADEITGVAPVETLVIKAKGYVGNLLRRKK